MGRAPVVHSDKYPFLYRRNYARGVLQEFQHGPSKISVGRDLIGKRLQILREIPPETVRVDRIAYLPSPHTLVINLETGAPGLTMPPAVLLRADQVIE